MPDPNTRKIPEVALPPEALVPIAAFLWGDRKRFGSWRDSMKIARDLLSRSAPAIVVAELERIADECEPPTDVEDYDQAEEDQRSGMRTMCGELRRRAVAIRAISTANAQGDQ